MTKIVATRIRVEESQHKTTYMPQYCVEKVRGGLFREPSTTRVWYDANEGPSFEFRTVFQVRTHGAPTCTLESSQDIIDTALRKIGVKQAELQHEKTKKISYVDYP